MDRPFWTSQLITFWIIAAAVWGAMCLLVVPLLGRYGKSRRSYIRSVGLAALTVLLMFVVALVFEAAVLMVFANVSNLFALIVAAIGMPVFAAIVAWGALGRFFRTRGAALAGQASGCLLTGAAIFLLGILPTFGRMRDIHKSGIDGTSLNSIGKGLLMYEQDHGCYPNDLRALVDKRFLQRSALVCVASGSRPDDSRPYAGPVDFGYIQLPTDATDDLVWAWQDPRFNVGEGGWILYKSHDVRWADPEKINRELARTRAWLAEHATATQPSGNVARDTPFTG